MCWVLLSFVGECWDKNATSTTEDFFALWISLVFVMRMKRFKRLDCLNMVVVWVPEGGFWGGTRIIREYGVEKENGGAASQRRPLRCRSQGTSTP
jgi:hypothetical protein